MSLDIQAARAVAEAAALRAGEVVRGVFSQPHEEVMKSNERDIVTEGDKASEAAIMPLLRAAFPDVPIVSEEGGGGTRAEDAPYAWHIDPIDGTTNFASGLPLFSISIALADRDGNPLVGVVYAPMLHELFSGALGYGATRNGVPIRVRETRQMMRAVMVSGFNTDRQLHTGAMREWMAMLAAVRDVRRFGSAALELSFVAAGILDGFWERGIHSWDCLAGLLLVREAGGTASDDEGANTHLYTGEIVVASNGYLHEAMLATLRTVSDESRVTSDE